MVTHYTRLAPLANIGNETKEAMKKKGQVTKSSKQAPKVSDQTICEAVDKYVDSWREEFDRLESLIKKVEAANKPKKYLLNKSTGSKHRIAAGFDEVGRACPTFCGWRYVNAPVTSTEDAPTFREECCGTCMPALRETLPLKKDLKAR